MQKRHSLTRTGLALIFGELCKEQKYRAVRKTRRGAVKLDQSASVKNRDSFTVQDAIKAMGDDNNRIC